MEVETIKDFNSQKHLEHYRKSGIEKVQFDKKGDDKIPLVLQYVSDYCTKHGFKLIGIETSPNGLRINYYIVKE